MGRIAFVFPGQGTQYPGMGQELCEVSPAAAEIFRQAEHIRPGTQAQCFEGPAELLQQTDICQPTMFTTELAAAAALEEAGIKADMAAGFSLGELAALSYTQVVDFSTSFHLVCVRGQLMRKCAERCGSSMAAVVKLSNEAVEEICSRFEHVYPVNYNCPGQVTIAALKSEMADFSAAVKAAGGRALPLKVSGGFHSPFMVSAANRFRKHLKDIPFRAPRIPLYSNFTGLPYDGPTQKLLAQQICNSVRWEQIVRHMISQGADTFIEVGPGNVLQGLIKKIDSSVQTFGVSDAESLAKTIQEVKPC